LKLKVIGLGNPLASDDAIGLHVARELQGMRLPSNVEVVAAGSVGPSILELIAGADKVVLIDAAIGGSKPGTVHRLSLDDIQTRKAKSLHEIGLADLLRVAQLSQPEIFPKKLVILGVEVADVMRCREGLSDAASRALQRAVKAVLRELRSEIASSR
jgi:hydrogenase maturation protease